MNEKPRLLRPVPGWLGLYIRPGMNDHQVISGLFSEEWSLVTGVVFDPCLDIRHQELREEVARMHIDVVLDPRTMELATIGGYNPKLAKLPWAGSKPHSIEDLRGNSGTRFVDALANHVANQAYTAILAPTHYIIGSSDPWFAIDQELTWMLRDRLDRLQRHDTLIYYPLGIPSAVFHNDVMRNEIIEQLKNLPIDALWLRIHPFGSDAGSTSVRHYIESARDLNRLRRPIVAEHTGTVGLSLLAFGGVGGIEGGITVGERFNVNGWFRPRDNGSGFLPQSRVYLPQLGIFLTQKEADAFLTSAQMKAAFACHDSNCCRKGARDMLGNPRRHFLIQRMTEVKNLSHQPPALRPTLYMDGFLRPATDLALRAMRGAPSELQPKFRLLQKRLESRRLVLSKMTSLPPGTVVPMIPERRRIVARTA